MEVPGTSKSIYVDAETLNKANELIKSGVGDSLSGLFRVLVSEKYQQQHLSEKQGKAKSSK